MADRGEHRDVALREPARRLQLRDGLIGLPPLRQAIGVGDERHRLLRREADRVVELLGAPGLILLPRQGDGEVQVQEGVVLVLLDGRAAGLLGVVPALRVDLNGAEVHRSGLVIGLGLEGVLVGLLGARLVALAFERHAEQRQGVTVLGVLLERRIRRGFRAREVAGLERLRPPGDVLGQSGGARRRCGVRCVDLRAAEAAHRRRQARRRGRSRVGCLGRLHAAPTRRHRRHEERRRRHLQKAVSHARHPPLLGPADPAPCWIDRKTAIFQPIAFMSAARMSRNRSAFRRAPPSSFT